MWRTGITMYRRFPVESWRNCSSFVVPTITEDRGVSIIVRPYGGRYLSVCRVRNALTLPTFDRRTDSSSAHSMIQEWATASDASLLSSAPMSSENHSSFGTKKWKNEDFRAPCGP